MLHKIIAELRDPLFYVVLFLIILNFVQPIISDRSDMKYESQVLSGTRYDSRPAFLDTAKLTYAEFKQLHDKRSFINLGGPATTPQGHYTNTIMDLAEYDECQTCVTPQDYYENKQPKTTKYYIALWGYSLRDNHSTFYMRNGQPRLEYAVWDKVDTSRDGALQRSGHYADKPLPFRFAYRNKEEEQKGYGQVLIPVDKATYRWVQITAIIIFIVVGLLGLYLCAGWPLEVLLRVAKGIVFTQQNVRQLYIAAWIWICIPFATVFWRIVFRLIFSRTITSDVQFLFWSHLREYQFVFIGGLLLLAIATAFRKGLSLQNEQSLTI